LCRADLNFLLGQQVGAIETDGRKVLRVHTTWRSGAGAAARSPPGEGPAAEPERVHAPCLTRE